MFDQTRVQLRQLDQFLRWIIAAAAANGVVYVGVGAWSGLSFIYLAAADAFVFVALALGIRHWLLKGHVQSSVVLLVSVTYMGLVLPIILLPDILPLIVLIPVMMIIMALPYVSQRMLGSLSMISLGAVLVFVVLAKAVNIFAPLPHPSAMFLLLGILPAAVAVLIWQLWQYRNQLTTMLESLHNANGELKGIQDDLEQQVADRTSHLQTALNDIQRYANKQERLIEELKEHREIISALSIPVLPLTEDMLVMPLIGALNSDRVTQVLDRALKAIQQNGARHLLLDLTGVSTVDYVVGQGLTQIITAAELMGTSVTLIGVRPDVAETIVGLDFDFRSVATAPDLQTSLKNYIRGIKAV